MVLVIEKGKYCNQSSELKALKKIRPYPQLLVQSGIEFRLCNQSSNVALTIARW